MEEVQQAHAMSLPMMLDSGCVVRTLAEWQAVEHVQAELAARTDLWEGIEFGLREENRKLRCEIDQLRKEMGDAGDSGGSVTSRACGVSVCRDRSDDRVGRDGVAQSLTLLPEPDARLGWGNAAMGEP